MLFQTIIFIFLCKIKILYTKTTFQKKLHIGGVFPMEAGAGGWPGGQVNNVCSI